MYCTYTLNRDSAVMENVTKMTDPISFAYCGTKRQLEIYGGGIFLFLEAEISS